MVSKASDMVDDGGVVWRPDQATYETSNLRAFMNACGARDFDDLISRSDQDTDWFWSQVFKYGNTKFNKPYDQIFDASDGIAQTRWCVGGQMNFTSECIERHSEDKEAIAIISSSEDGETRVVKRETLFEEISKLAGALRKLGVSKGDRVAVYMPMIPEVAVAFMAVARLGAITVPLFSGFGADAIASRLAHSGAKVVLTVAAMNRRGSEIYTKPVLEQAIEKSGTAPAVIVHGDTPAKFLSWEKLTEAASPVTEPEIVDADDPLLIVYTSGTTGKPKGAILTHCGFTGKLILDLQICLDLKATDRWLWMSDFGWIIGPIMVGASLMTGNVLVMADGAPDYPEPDRIWNLIEDTNVTFLGVAPTLIRSTMARGIRTMDDYDFGELRVVVSSGEPWTNEAWFWCFENICLSNIPILNWSGGTEISGGILTGTMIHPLKPLTFSAAIPGMGADIYDGDGVPVDTGQVGELVLKKASIGLTRGLWNDENRYMDTYWSDFTSAWKHGDLTSRDADGYWYLHGRSDDVLKIGGKRTGPSEIENLLVETGLVSDAGVFGLSDERAGQAIGCVCVLAPGGIDTSETREQLRRAVGEGMGRPYRPKFIGFVNELPKTRSGKVVRRVISAAVLGKSVGDISSLANPSAIDQIREIAQDIAQDIG